MSNPKCPIRAFLGRRIYSSIERVEGPTQGLAPQLKAAFGEFREAVPGAIAGGVGGTQACAQLSEAVDDLVRELWSRVCAELDSAQTQALALAATGGWGRQKLCPYSRMLKLC